MSQQRQALGLGSDEDWRAYLDAAGVEASDLEALWRDDMTRWAVVSQQAQAAGITVSQAEYDQAWTELVNSSTPEGLAASLKEAGITETVYRSVFFYHLLEEKLKEALFPQSQYGGDASQKQVQQREAFAAWYQQKLQEYGVDNA